MRGKQARTTGRGRTRGETINPRERATPRNGTPNNEPPETRGNPAQQAAPSYDKQGGEKGGTRQDRTRAARWQDIHETEMGEASKLTIEAGNGGTGYEPSREDETQGRRLNRTRRIRRGGKQARSRKRTGRGTRGTKRERGPTQANKTRRQTEEAKRAREMKTRTAGETIANERKRESDTTQ